MSDETRQIASRWGSRITSLNVNAVFRYSHLPFSCTTTSPRITADNLQTSYDWQNKILLVLSNPSNILVFGITQRQFADLWSDAAASRETGSLSSHRSGACPNQDSYILNTANITGYRGPSDRWKCILFFKGPGLNIGTKNSVSLHLPHLEVKNSFGGMKDDSASLLLGIYK